MLCWGEGGRWERELFVLRGVIRVCDELVLDREAVRGKLGRERSAAWAWAAEPSMMVGSNRSYERIFLLVSPPCKGPFPEGQNNEAGGNKVGAGKGNPGERESFALGGNERR